MYYQVHRLGSSESHLQSNPICNEAFETAIGRRYKEFIAAMVGEDHTNFEISDRKILLF
jgi:hypothetical protein